VNCYPILPFRAGESSPKIVYSGRSSALNPYVIRAVFRLGGVQLHNFSIYFKGVHKYERYHSCRRCRHPALPADHGHQQAAAAGLRQADDLLPPVHADAGRHSGHPDPTDTPRFEALLGDGSQYGIHLQYKVQPSPDGLAQAFILGEEFIGDDCCAMILGDNIFYGNGFSKILKTAAANAENKGRCTVFGYYVQDPERFGIVEFDKDGKVLSVEEKPQHPKSNYAITGLYFYNKEVVKMAKQVKPSARGELEITTLNDMYLKKDELDVQLLGRGFAWLDTGTMDSLVEAADFVRMIEKRQGIKISAPEEIAFKYGWIDRDTLLESAERYGKSPYGQHLKNVADGKLRY